MTIRKIAELLEAKVILGEDKLDLEVDMAFSSDMMSDVLAYVHGRTVLLTGLVNEHVIRTAEMVDLECIVLCARQGPHKGDHRHGPGERHGPDDHLAHAVLHQRHPLFQRPDRHRKEAVTCP